jgi:hypothetical protein
MRLILAFCGLLVLALCLVPQLRAEIIEGGEESIVFSPGKVQNGVTWSDSLLLTPGGLSLKELEPNQVMDIWIQTHAFPIGLSWRPPRGANFTVILDGALTTPTTVASDPEIFIRYSSDKVRWSSWYVFQRENDSTAKSPGNFKSMISVPYIASERYERLMKEWWRTKPVWSSDENEFCEWLIKNEPDFFAREMPFIGYVQVRLERRSARYPQEPRSMKIQYSWGVGGLTSIPRDKSKVRKDIDEKWFFTTGSK